MDNPVSLVILHVVIGTLNRYAAFNLLCTGHLIYARFTWSYQ